MKPSDTHVAAADVSFDGGDLDCGNGLLLLIRRHIDPMAPGQLLEVRSTEISVDEDLPAWCRLTRNDLMSWTKSGRQRSFLICKGPSTARDAHAESGGRKPAIVAQASNDTTQQKAPRTPVPAPAVAPLSVMGIGSWPRPRWMISAMHDHIAHRLSDAQFQESANDAVQLAVAAQVRAGADVVTDGEQRRDSYASFVASRLDNCQLIPLVDLLPLVDDPAEFERELRALDVPAADVRHPAVLGRIARSRPLVAHEVDYARSLTDRPVKVALPGPYLLTRTMWMECIQERAYASREDLAADIVQVLREELAELMEAGTALVQFDEPVLTDVVFTGAKAKPSFMCGAMSESRGPEIELAFARDLVNAVIAGFPRERTALHVCRGNWTPDESVALAGDYQPLVTTLAEMRVGAYLLEMCTPRAGDMDVLRRLPEDARIGVGVVNQKSAEIETEAGVSERIRAAMNAFGRERVLLHPDCGFATFADNPICGAQGAEAKLAVMARAAQSLR